MTILAIDPASHLIGIAFSNAGIYTYYTLKISNKTLPERLSIIRAKLYDLIIELEPEHIVTEQAIIPKRQKHGAVVAYVVGILFEICGTLDIPVYEMPIKLAKKHISGNAGASKTDVQDSLRALGYDNFETDDASDALSILLAFESRQGFMLPRT